MLQCATGMANSSRTHQGGQDTGSFQRDTTNNTTDISIILDRTIDALRNVITEEDNVLGLPSVSSVSSYIYDQTLVAL